jgi:ParB family chromosome partitioning protein
MEIALVENIQRQDLNAIEEAEAYDRLIGEFGHTQEALAKIVHKSRSHVANLLRLLELPAPVRQMVIDGAIEMGHARALIGAPDPEKLAREVAAKGLSVRETEKLARAAKPHSARKPTVATRDADIDALERHLGDVLGLHVRIAHGAKGGSISLAYATLDQLDMVCQRLTGERI